MIQAQIYIDKDKLKGTKPLDQFIMQLLIDNGISGEILFVGHSGFSRQHHLK